MNAMHSSVSSIFVTPNTEILQFGMQEKNEVRGGIYRLSA
jgi:hypothetical protein